MANPVAKRFGENLKSVRGSMGQKELADKVTALGVPMRFNTVSRIEQGHRVADVLELLALALALGVTPNRLLLSTTADNVGLQLTENVEVSERQAWRWAVGERPLPKADQDEERTWTMERVVEAVTFSETNQPHRPPNPTTMDEVYSVFPKQLAAVREAVLRTAAAEGVPLRVVQSDLCSNTSWATESGDNPGREP